MILSYGNPTGLIPNANSKRPNVMSLHLPITSNETNKRNCHKTPNYLASFLTRCPWQHLRFGESLIDLKSLAALVDRSHLKKTSLRYISGRITSSSTQTDTHCNNWTKLCSPLGSWGWKVRHLDADDIDWPLASATNAIGNVPSETFCSACNDVTCRYKPYLGLLWFAREISSAC
jgi:hypothetical protein